ncbi:MAG TPA: nucleoside triphosphate pyrophosphohydrolase family protein [Candidatus Paceibacterota bacterium]|nr:nucleoside triphosphate pyrophosphohydrolase family protein [Candidatus Pacearchaeota archaeon]HRZ50823.1 nucleoside triphosphate pyrophosphohydrolase family protein [Candidatus Paceibacterota bacterium]HSA36544.1 nucleoside triphosphate pyrophosphohydrolase family protein [Candidatus Paceibacterota bacterium]
MEFNDYQTEARKTAMYPNLGGNFIYPTLGLAGEAGEVAEKIKKVIRDANGVVSEEKKGELSKELGDVLWYVANLAEELSLSLDDIAERNLEKLKSRQERGKLKGDGDNR